MGVKMLKTIKSNSFFTAFFAVITLVSCDPNRVFDAYVSIPDAAWEVKNNITFNFSIEDTLARRNLFINLRNNNDYSFSNLFLITKMKFPNGQKITDTLEYDMADVTGKFLGEGFTEIKENKLFYKENITFPITGDYTVEITQAMRKNNTVNGVIALKGITDVGFRIEKTH